MHSNACLIGLSDLATLQGYASDTELCQAPVLVLPYCFLERLPSTLPEVVRPLTSIKPSKSLAWAELANELLKDAGILEDAAMESRPRWILGSPGITSKYCTLQIAHGAANSAMISRLVLCSLSP